MDRGRQAGLVHAVCHRCWTTHPESNSNSNPPPQHTRPGPLAPRPSLRPRRLPPIRMPAHGVLSARPPGPPRPSSAPRRSQSPPAPSPASPPHVPREPITARASGHSPRCARRWHVVGRQRGAAASPVDTRRMARARCGPAGERNAPAMGPTCLSIRLRWASSLAVLRFAFEGPALRVEWFSVRREEAVDEVSKRARTGARSGFHAHVPLSLPLSAQSVRGELSSHFPAGRVSCK